MNTALGKDVYAKFYENDIEGQSKWLEYGAIDKANSVISIAQKLRITPETVLELGCGSGAVITECARRGFGSRYFGIDYSTEAIAYLRDKAPFIKSFVADITSPDFTLDQYFDVVILSHVLEHLEDPLSFLKALHSKLQFKLLIAEVPLEHAPEMAIL